MSCSDCQAAAGQPHHGFTASCRGCQARALARSPAFAEARRAQRLTPDYRNALERLGLSHEEVKDAARADALHAARQGA
jgi:hypothetical protein